MILLIFEKATIIIIIIILSKSKKMLVKVPTKKLKCVCVVLVKSALRGPIDPKLILIPVIFEKKKPL